MQTTGDYLGEENAQKRIPRFFTQRNNRRIDWFHLSIEVHRAKRSILRGPAKEQPRIVQEQTRFQTTPGTKQRCGVEDMSSRLSSIYEHGVHALILKAVADIGKPIHHLKSSFTAAPHTNDDQTARTHYIVEVQTFVVVRPQVYVCVDHVHSSAHVWRCFVNSGVFQPMAKPGRG